MELTKEQLEEVLARQTGRIEARFTLVDERFVSLESKMAGLDSKISTIDLKIDGVEDRLGHMIATASAKCTRNSMCSPNASISTTRRSRKWNAPITSRCSHA